MHRTLLELIHERATATPGRPFVADARSARVLDYAALRAAADAWAGALAAVGVPVGSRVLVDVSDPLAFAAVHLSVIAAGRCSAPVDPTAPPAQAHRARDALRPALVISDRDGPGVRQVDGATGLPSAPSSRTTPSGSAPSGSAPSGSALLLTSGSTGAPKAVLLAERQLLHVAQAVATHHRLTATDRGYNSLPLFHINAQVVGLLATLVAGGSLCLDARFRRTGFWQLIERREITWVNAVPAILSILAGDDVPPAPPALRFIRSASAPLPVAIRMRISAASGLPVIESYGMTEAASQITATSLDGPYRPGSVGRPVGTEVEVIAEDGSRCAPEEVGRVRIRGAGVISGYADGVAAERFDDGGWLDTGDLGRRDRDGYIYLVGRADDVINRGGELVYPREVEEVLLGDPAVADAVVVGRPDAVLGTVPVAWVRPAATPAAEHGDGDAALVGRLVERCGLNLSRYKRPAEIRLVTDLPVGPTGKVRRRTLRDLLAGEEPTAGIPPAGALR